MDSTFCSDFMDVAVGTIVGALVGVGGTILVNWLGNRKEYKNISAKIGELPNTTLSGEHEQIKNDITHNMEKVENELNNKIGTLDNTTLSGQNIIIKQQLDDLQKYLIESEKTKNIQRQNLTGDMNNIDNSISALSSFADVMKQLQTDKIELQSKLLEADKQIKSLQLEIQYLKNPPEQSQKLHQNRTLHR